MSGQAPTVGALSGAPPPLGGDQNRGPTVNAVTWSLTAVATFFVVVRMYGRYFITRNPGRDDLFAMLGLVSIPMQVGGSCQSFLEVTNTQ